MLPIGWSEHVDPRSQRVFYYHAATSVSTWTPPASQVEAQQRPQQPVDESVSIGSAVPALSWTVPEVVAWASTLGLDADSASELAAALTENAIDGVALLALTAEDIKDDLEVKKLGPRKKVLAGIEELRAAMSPEGDPDPDANGGSGEGLETPRPDKVLKDEWLPDGADGALLFAAEAGGGGGGGGGRSQLAPEPTFDAAALSDAQVKKAVRVVEHNHGLVKGRVKFQQLVPGTEIVNQKCVLCDGVLQRYYSLQPNSSCETGGTSTDAAPAEEGGTKGRSTDALLYNGVDIDTMSFKALRQACEKAGLSGEGAKPRLLYRLRAWLESQ